MTLSGQGGLLIRNSQGQSMVQVGITDKETAHVMTMNSKGEPLVQLGEFKSGTGGVFTFNGNGSGDAHITSTLGKP